PVGRRGLAGGLRVAALPAGLGAAALDAVVFGAAALAAATLGGAALGTGALDADVFEAGAFDAAAFDGVGLDGVGLDGVASDGAGLATLTLAAFGGAAGVMAELARALAPLLARGMRAVATGCISSTTAAASY